MSVAGCQQFDIFCGFNSLVLQVKYCSLPNVVPENFMVVFCTYDRKLGRLTSCYERVFQRHCGVTGGRLVAGLMNLAFADPHYQRYRYRPDCRLHARRRRVVPTSSPDSDGRQRCRDTSTASRPHHHVAAVILTAVVASTLILVSSS